MAELLDSGTRREWETGAVRDAADGKGRCDLLPLGVIGEFYDGADTGEVFIQIEKYLRSGKTEYLQNAIETFTAIAFDGKWVTAFLEVSKQYEDGAKKYNDRNWENGIPLHCYIDSGVRHYLKFLRGDKDEPHDRAVCWNLLCAIWTHKNKPEMIDLPFRQPGEEAR